MTVKVDFLPSEFELESHVSNTNNNINNKNKNKDGLDDNIGIDNEKIISLYLQRQESTLKDGDTYRAYLENHETVRATRRRQLFKHKEAIDEGREKVDYTLYQRRECITGIPKSPGSDRCGCNKLLSHPSHLTYPKEPGLRWNYKEHTKLETTNAYGRVKFSSYQRAKYVRLDADSNLQQLADLVQNVFNLATPGVIISVKGSLLGFSVTAKVEKVIQRGLMKAAMTTNGWITTSGIDAGYVISIGEALRMHNHTVPCIGFSSWGCLPEVVKEALTVEKPELLEQLGENTCSYPKLKLKPGSSVENLEANHSHHILSDTGAIGDWGSESFIRTKWEAYMRDELNIPVVMVVMQGSIGASLFLLEGLKAGTPAVVVYGSGGISDVIVNLVRHYKEISLNKQNRQLNRQPSALRRVNSLEELNHEICTCGAELSQSCPVVNHIIDDAKFEKVTRESPKFLSCVIDVVTLYQDLLILFDLEDDNYDGLDAALLEAMVKAQSLNEAKQEAEATASTPDKKINLSGVQVALGWNRPDFAERLLKADTSAKDQIALGSILIHALAWNLHEFTEMLITHDASIPMVAANTIVLYNSSHNSEHLKRFVRYNMGYKSKEIRFTKETVDKIIDKLVATRNDFRSNVSNESDPYFELMVWAALTLYPEIAYMMWQGTQEPIRAALCVVMMLKRLSKATKVIINANEKKVLQAMIVKFESLSIAILDNLQQIDSTVCERALNSGWQRLNNKTYIDMAFRAKAKDFIAHPACQEICERRWKGGVTSEVNIMTVLLVTICPLLLLTHLVTFRTEYTRAKTGVQKFLKKYKAYITSPSVKFWFGVMCYIAFIVLQTHVMLTELEVNSTINATKIVYLVWLAMWMVDEVIQLSTLTFRDWARNVFNKVDTIMYILTVIGLVLVLIPTQAGSTGERTYYDIGRIFLSLGSILFYLRLLHMFTIDSSLGPTILMIIKMFRDFKVFVVMFFVVAIAFGVGYTVALTDPHEWAEHNSNKTEGYVVGIVYYTFFQMYGELFLDELVDGQGKHYEHAALKSNERTSYVVVLVLIYMAIVVLMLVNILIAMFSDTYARVKVREEVIFKYQRLELLLDTENSFLPPPFSLFHILLDKLVPSSRGEKEGDPASGNKWKDTVIRSAVVDCLEEHLKRERNAKNSETEALVRESTKMLKNRLNKLQRYVESIQNSIESVSNRAETNTGLVADI